MKLSIFSLNKILFVGQITSLTCRTLLGEITVLNNHQPLISMLAKGAIKAVDATQKEHFFEVASGFLEVRKNNEARCIIEQ